MDRSNIQNRLNDAQNRLSNQQPNRGNLTNRPALGNNPGSRNFDGSNIQNRVEDARNRLNSGNLTDRPNLSGNRLGNTPDGPNRVTTNRADALGNRLSNSPFDNRINNRIGNNTNINATANFNAFNSRRLWNPYQYNDWNRNSWNFWGPGFGRYGYGSGFGIGYGYGGGWWPYGNGAYGPWYGYGWYGRPWGRWAAIGLTSWALGGRYYNTGYAGYYNPYYSSGYGSAYNYSQPITYVISDDNGGTPSPQTSSHFQSARDAFYNGDYNNALQNIDQAITDTPDDPTLHEFRALTLFALQRYPESAATLYAVLSVGPGMNWSSVLSLYPSVDVYTPQLRNLEEYVRQHPDDASGRFVLGYHYMVGTHVDAARKQFERTAESAPKDQVAHQLARVLTPPVAGATDNPGDVPPAPAAGEVESRLSTAPPALSNPEGEYLAQAGAQGTIGLKLAADDTFTWTFTKSGQPQQFNGTYTIQGDTLALDFADGGGMVGTVKRQDDGFHFAVVNGPQADPGLDFVRR